MLSVDSSNIKLSDFENIKLDNLSLKLEIYQIIYFDMIFEDKNIEPVEFLNYIKNKNWENIYDDYYQIFLKYVKAWNYAFENIIGCNTIINKKIYFDIYSILYGMQKTKFRDFDGVVAETNIFLEKHYNLDDNFLHLEHMINKVYKKNPFEAAAYTFIDLIKNQYLLDEKDRVARFFLNVILLYHNKAYFLFDSYNFYRVKLIKKDCLERKEVEKMIHLLQKNQSNPHF